MATLHYWNRNTTRNKKLLELFRKTGDLKLSAAHFEIGAVAAREALKKMGCEFPRKKLLASGACSRNKELVLRMYHNGDSLPMIAKAVGTTRRSVRRFLRYKGIENHTPRLRRRETHYNWKGGRVVDKDGYVLLLSPNHPHCRKHTGYVFEHRLVMEKVIGRFLLPEEVVHHRDGNKQNNRPDNLQLFSENSKHLAHELKGRVPKWTPDGLARMKAGIARSAIARRERNLRSP